MTEQPKIRANAAAQKLSVMASTLLSRLSWLSKAGLTHEGKRDLWTVFGYNRDLTAQDLYEKYRRQDISRTIVESPADALWTRPPILKDTDPEFVSQWQQIVRDHNVWSVLNRADYMTGFSRFAIIIIGLNDGKRLEDPVVPGNHQVTYLQPYSELGITINDYENDPTSPRFGLPTYYQVQLNETEQGIPGRNVSAAPRVSFRVHWSRTVHICDGVVEDPVFGIPRLEPVYNLLTDMLKMVGGAAETYWLTANRGMQIDVDKEMELAPEDEAALENEIDEWYHGLRRFMRTRGITMNELGTKVSDPTLSVSSTLALISATSRIPQRILLGTEAGQLASEQDRANWAERVGERRNKFAEPQALLPLMSRLASIGAVPKPSSITFEWPEAFILAPLERAQTSAQKARSAANLNKVLTDNPKFLTIDECRNIVGLGDEVSILENTPIESSGISPTD